MVIVTRPWEHRTRREQQLALAGSTPREQYLENRVALAIELRHKLGIESQHRGFEIGSGEGVVARELAPHCGTLDCADISRTFLKLARLTCAGCPNVRFHRIRKSFLGFLPTGRYDFGYAMNVFIHFNVYEAYFYLRDVARLLRPGGGFLLSLTALGPDTAPLFHYFAERYRRRRVITPGFMRWHDLPTLCALAVEAGLELDEGLLERDGGHLKIVLRRP